MADPNGHIISMSLTHNAMQFQIINVYGPGTQKESFYENLEEYILSAGPLIICGDFNFTEKPADREGPGKFALRNQKGSLSFSKIKNRYDLHDVWRSLNPKTTQFTYYELIGLTLLRILLIVIMRQKSYLSAFLIIICYLQPCTPLALWLQTQVRAIQK